MSATRGAATLLIAQGVHPRVVMETLGHSTIVLTMNTYGHVVPALQRDAADRLDAVLAPRPDLERVAIGRRMDAGVPPAG